MPVRQIKVLYNKSTVCVHKNLPYVVFREDFTKFISIRARGISHDNKQLLRDF